MCYRKKEGKWKNNRERKNQWNKVIVGLVALSSLPEKLKSILSMQE